MNRREYIKRVAIVTAGGVMFPSALSSCSKDPLLIVQDWDGKIGMDAGMKIILKFNAPFWGNEFGGIIGDEYIPEFWQPHRNPNVLTTFIMGEKAEYLSTQGADAVNIAVQELDKIYGGSKAPDALIDSHIMDWYKEPFIKGAYSYPMPGTEGYRPVLAKPVNDQLYFAGEATHYEGHSATVHGAMETGYRAVKEIIESLY